MDTPKPTTPNTTPLPADIAPPAGTTPAVPAAPSEPMTATTHRSSVFSLPMKLGLIIFVTLVIAGAVVMTQKNSLSGMYNQDNKVVAKQIPPTVTVDPASMVVSPTVTGEIPLSITSPQSGTTVSTPNVVISGKTSPNADVTINDSDTKADAQGNFSLSILLDQGDNIITITSVDPNGKYAEKEIKVTLNTGA